MDNTVQTFSSLVRKFGQKSTSFSVVAYPLRILHYLLLKLKSINSLFLGFWFGARGVPVPVLVHGMPGRTGMPGAPGVPGQTWLLLVADSIG